jgi:hypothetical protein
MVGEVQIMHILPATISLGIHLTAYTHTLLLTVSDAHNVSIAQQPQRCSLLLFSLPEMTAPSPSS